MSPNKQQQRYIKCTSNSFSPFNFRFTDIHKVAVCLGSVCTYFLLPEVFFCVCLCVSIIPARQLLWCPGFSLSSTTEFHNIPSIFSSTLAFCEAKHHLPSCDTHYDKIQLLVLFMGGRKSVSFGKVSLRRRSAGLRRLGRFACCRSSLNTSTTLEFSFAEVST